jgi:hypothetical protein
MVPRRLIEAAACALAAHALVYRTLLPGDGMHGYFTWYEPAVGVASLLSLLWLLFAVVRTVSGRASSPPSAQAPFATTFGELFGSTFLFLLVQESFERSVETGRPAVAIFTPASVLALAAAASVVAVALAAARCLGRAAVQMLLRTAEPGVADGGAQRWHVALAPTVRPRPLAERFGMRAPPLAAG